MVIRGRIAITRFVLGQANGRISLVQCSTKHMRMFHDLLPFDLLCYVFASIDLTRISHDCFSGSVAILGLYSNASVTTLKSLYE